jgi:hypothetical protein
MLPVSWFALTLSILFSKLLVRELALTDPNASLLPEMLPASLSLMKSISSYAYSRYACAFLSMNAFVSMNVNAFFCEPYFIAFSSFELAYALPLLLVPLDFFVPSPFASRIS